MIYVEEETRISTDRLNVRVIFPLLNSPMKLRIRIMETKAINTKYVVYDNSAANRDMHAKLLRLQVSDRIHSL